MVTGSLLNNSIHRATVWGTGCAWKSDLDPNRFASPSEEFRIIATRGLLSKKMVEENGHQPITYGDPGILLPNFYQPNVSKKYNVGIVCSWVDYHDVRARYNNEKITVINTMGDIEDIINRINECEIIISSALHGIITAIAYKIPTACVKFSDKMIGDGFKYQDFSTCLNTPLNMINLEESVLELEELVNLSSIYTLIIDADNLFNCCPFRCQP
jgi:pyruvyltransferase